jgi:RimJ/RimL family protein N-acetyltransferase
MEPPRLKTERLLLREFRAADLAPDLEQAQDPEVQRYLGGVRTPYDAFRTMATHAGHWMLRGFGQWAVERREDGRYVGRVGLWEPVGWPGPEIGWRLGRESWGHGYATEAAHAAIGWAWTALAMERLSSMIVPENTPSQRVAQRLGHVNTGPCELPVGTCDRWVLERPGGDAPWAQRAATPGDAPAVAAAVGEAMARYRDISPPDWSPREADVADEREVLAHPDYRCVLAEPGGVLAGHVGWWPAIASRHPWAEPDVAHLRQLFVHPGWWGSGLASRLLAVAADGARAAGCRRMRLFTPGAQGRARRFYERAGFIAAGPPADDEVFGMPTVLYELEL